MSGNVHSTDESNYSIGDEVLKDLMGKVAEMGSAVKENTAQAKKIHEVVSKLPVVEKQMEVTRDWVKRLEDGGKAVGEEVRQLSGQIAVLAAGSAMPTDAIAHLRNQLDVHARLFEKPLHKDVHYRHFLGWPVRILFVMALLLALSVAGWYSAHEGALDGEQGDVKYRYMKLQNDTAVQKAVYAADEGWRTDPDQFKNLVEAGEEQVRQWYNGARAQMELDSAKVRRNKQKKQR